jgi:hypothetical protein
VWTLTPRSEATLIDAGERLTIRLESGAVLSRVVPSAKQESYAVVVGDVRVAVRGTLFRVERRNERAFVTVHEGVVAVGPASAGVTEGFLLRAGDQGSFTLDGKTGTVQRAATAELDSKAARATPVPPRAPAARPVPPTPVLPESPTTAELDGASTAWPPRSRAASTATSTGEVRVTARTRLTARARARRRAG